MTPVKDNRKEENESADQEDFRFKNYPEIVEFTGIGRVSQKSTHIVSLIMVAVGIIFLVVDYPAGFLLLITFLFLVLGFEVFMNKRANTAVKISLYLRRDPVEAVQNSSSIGEIKSGAIETRMDEPTEIGFRPAPGRELFIWRFQSKEDAETVARRLLEYLPRDRED